jgi:carbonic anhydrase
MADEAIENYSSVGALLDAASAYGTGPTQNNVLEVIQFKQEVLDTPVFRQYTDLGVAKCASRARGTDSFGKSIVALGYRSGYRQNITIRGCRRWALMEAGMNHVLYRDLFKDKKHTETARIKIGGQMKRETFGRSYAHLLTRLMGLPTFWELQAAKSTLGTDAAWEYTKALTRASIYYYEIILACLGT